MQLRIILLAGALVGAAAPAFADCRSEIRNTTPHISANTPAAAELNAAGQNMHDEKTCMMHLQRAQQLQQGYNQQQQSGSSTGAIVNQLGRLLNGNRNYQQ